MKRWAPGVSLIFVRHQCGLMIEPVVPVAEVTEAESNVTDPKSASGSAWQANWLRHTDGASTIHSAELTSMLDA